MSQTAAASVLGGVRDLLPTFRERADEAERLRADPTWTVHDLPTTHNVLADGPDVLVRLVDDVLAAVAAR